MRARPAHSLNRLLGVLGALLIFTLPAADAVVQYTDPHLDPKQDYVSQGAYGGLGPLVVLGLAASGIALLVLAVLEWRLMPAGWLRRATVFLMAAAGVSTLATSFVPADPGGGMDSLRGTIHIGLAATAVTCVALAPLPTSLATPRRLVRLAAGLVPLTILGCAVALGVIKFSDAGMLEGTRGVWERIALGAVLLWACVRFSTAVVTRWEGYAAEPVRSEADGAETRAGTRAAEGAPVRLR